MPVRVKVIQFTVTIRSKIGLTGIGRGAVCDKGMKYVHANMGQIFISLPCHIVWITVTECYTPLSHGKGHFPLTVAANVSFSSPFYLHGCFLNTTTTTSQTNTAN